MCVPRCVLRGSDLKHLHGRLTEEQVRGQGASTKGSGKQGIIPCDIV